MYDAQTIAGHSGEIDVPYTPNDTRVPLEIITWPSRPNQPRRLSLLLSNTDAAALGQALITRSTHNRKGSRKLSTPSCAEGDN